MYRIDIMTLFPDVVGDMLCESILGRGQERGYIRIECHQIRDYTLNKQRQVDDYPDRAVPAGPVQGLVPARAGPGGQDQPGLHQVLQSEAHRTAVRPERSPRRAPSAEARRGPFFRGGKKSWGKRPASIEKQGEIAYNQGDKTPSEERD